VDETDCSTGTELTGVFYRNKFNRIDNLLQYPYNNIYPKKREITAGLKLCIEIS